MIPVKLDSRHFVLVKDRFVAKAAELQGLMRKQVHGDIDPLVALRNVFEAEHAYIVSGYLVVYDITEMWFTDAPVLAEQLVFRLAEGGVFTDVVDFLELKAREAGAKWLCVGTTLAKSDRALASVYERHGFSRTAIHLAKEIA